MTKRVRTAVAGAAGSLVAAAASVALVLPVHAATIEPDLLPSAPAVDRSVVAPVVVPLSDCSAAEVNLPVVDQVVWSTVDESGAATLVDPTRSQHMDPRTDRRFRVDLVHGARFTDGSTRAEWLVGPGSRDLDTGCAVTPPAATTPAATAPATPVPSSTMPVSQTESDDPGTAGPVDGTDEGDASGEETEAAVEVELSPTVETRVLSASLTRPAAIATVSAAEVTELAQTGPAAHLLLAAVAGLLIGSGALMLHLTGGRSGARALARH